MATKKTTKKKTKTKVTRARNIARIAGGVADPALGTKISQLPPEVSGNIFSHLNGAEKSSVQQGIADSSLNLGPNHPGVQNLQAGMNTSRASDLAKIRK
jgi:hypothetical protein